MIEFVGVSKQNPGGHPLRVARLTVVRGDGLSIGGLDAGAAELFVNLVTGAALPDTGDVRIAGRSTRDIATDTEWLASLDRFGIVTERAVLLESLPLEANLALPFTLAIDPIGDEIRATVTALAGEVGLETGRLSAPITALSAEQRLRAHLARALGPRPEFLLLEHPTARLDAAASAAFGAMLKAVAAERQLGWVALNDDDRFARASGARRLRLEADGRVREEGLWRRLLS